MIQIRSYFSIRRTLPLLVLLAPGAPVHAEPPLPYTLRTHGYSAWDSSVRGDLRTVGLAGAMVGLADSRLGSVDNPAGLPLTLDSTGIQLTGNSKQDGYVQSYASMITTGSAVATFCPYPWGAAVAVWSPQSEGDTYLVGGATREALSVTTHEYHLSAANLFLGDRLSIGLSAIVGENTQSFTPEGGGTLTRSAWGFGLGIGALYQTPRRVLVGFSFTPPIHYAMNPEGDINPLIQSYFQPADSPYRLGFGVGWIPNRFFRVSTAVYVFGSTSNTALLSDDTRLVGVNTTVQPRAGVSYLLADFKELQVELEAGTYLEVLRIQDDFSRLHGTIAIEVKPWVLNLGWGVDEARFYENFIFSAGIDLGRLLRKLDLIPPERKYVRGGFLPNPTRFSDEGLSHPMSSSWQPRPEDNAIDVGMKMPTKIREGVINAPERVKDVGGEVIDTLHRFPENLPDVGVRFWNWGVGDDEGAKSAH